MTKQDVMQVIESYNYNIARLLEIEKRIESITPKVTATYGNVAGGRGSGVSNPVESQGVRISDLKRKAHKHKVEVQKVVRMIEHSGLSKREKELMWWLARNGKLQAFARREHIGKDNVYKIRDRAVNKIIAANSPQNVV